MRESRRLITILFLIVGVFTMNIPFAVAKENIEVKNITVSEKSSTITVENIVFENNTINSKIYFNQLNDFVTFDIELKNDTNNDYTLEDITNNINSDYLVVETSNKGNIIRKNTTDTIKVKIRYNKELVNHDDISLNDVSIGLVFSNPTINVNPLTNSNVLFLLITIIVISILSFYAIKNKKSKLFLLLFLLIPTFVFAVEKTTVEIKFNDLNIAGRYLQYRVQVFDNDTSLLDTDITYGQEIGTLPDLPQKDGYNDNGWVDQHNNAVTSETVVTEDLIITPDYNAIEYNITYNLNNGTLERDNPTKYTVEDEFTLNNPVIEGYTFSGWAEGTSGVLHTSVTIFRGTIGDKTFTAFYSPNEDTTYTVIHRQMNMNGEYVEYEREVLHGATDTPVTPQVKDYPGFTAPMEETKNIDGNGQTTFVYDYSRNRYQFTVTDREYLDSTSTANGEYYYGTTITLKAQNRVGYDFEWSDGDTNLTRTFTLESDKTLTPRYTAKTNIQYKVVHKKMNLDGETYSTADEITYYGTTGATIQPDTNIYEGFTAPSKKTDTINGDGSTVVEYLYSRNKYNLTIEDSEWVETATPSDEYYYGTSITLRAKDRDEYTFVKWSNENTNVEITFELTGNTTIKPIYAKNSYVITFNYSGGEGEEAVRIVEPDTAIGALPAGIRNDYYLDGWYTGLTDGQKVDASYVPTGSIELFARWKKSVEAMNITNTNITVNIEEEENIEISNANEIEEEYTFTSNDTNVASVDSDGKVTGVGVGNTTITITGIKSLKTKTINVTVLSNKYVVTFNSNGGTVSEESREVTKGQHIGTLPTGTKENNYLEGWYTSLTNGIKIEATYVPVNDMEIVAKWMKSIDVANITNENISIIKDATETINITNPNEIEEEYTFTSNNEEVATVDSNGLVTGVGVGNTTITMTGTSSNRTRTINVTVLSNQYVITFDSNGGTVSEESRPVTIGQAIGELPTGTKENKYLDGWYTSIDPLGEKVNASYVPTGSITLVARWKNSIDMATIENTNISVLEGETESINITNANEIEEEYTFTSNDEEVATVSPSGVVTGVSEGTTTITITGSKSGHTKTVNVTVTEPISNYVVTLNVNGGTMTGATTIEVTPGEAVGTLPTPTKDGSTFDHWRLTTETGTIITATYVPTSDITLVARWVPSDKVAEIDGTFYDTMLDAVNAVPTTGVQTTVRMINDFDYNDANDQLFPAGTNIILDLNGHTVKNKGNAVIKNFGTLLIKNGTIKCAAGQGAVNNNKGVTLTLDNVTVNSVSTRQAVYNKGGHMIIRNCTMTTTTSSQRPCVQNLNDGTSIGTMVITNSTITSPNSFGLYVEGGQVTIGEEDGNILSTPVITGQTYGVAAYGTINLYDGILKGKTGAIGIAANTGNSPRMSVDTNHTKILDIDDAGEYLEGTDGDYKTLTLQYKEPKYKVTLNASGGSVNPPEINVTQGEAVGELPTPTREEYNFLGWYTGLTDGVEVTSTYVPESDVEIFARWETIPTYTITYEANGGSSVQEVRIVQGSSLATLPTSTKDGYYLDGWYTLPDATGEKVTTSYVPQGDIILYARWKTSVKSMSINPNEITIGSPIRTETINITNANEIEESYTFTSNNTNVVTVDSNGVLTPVSEGTTTVTITGLVSNQKKIVNVVVEYNYITVNYDANGGVTRTASKQVILDEAIGSLPDVAYDEWHTFDGWYTSLDYDEEVESDYVPTEDITLYVKWMTIPTYNITFNSNDGTSVDSIKVIQGEPIGELPVSYNGNNYFDGWYRDVNLENAVNSSYVPTSDMTLYAKWIDNNTYYSSNRYSVSFDSNGGSYSDDIEVVQGDSIGTLPTVYRDNYQFDGWCTSLQTGIAIDDSYVPNSNMILYAKWSLATNYTITFDVNGGNSITDTTRTVSGVMELGTLPTPTRSNYHFVGWLDEDTGLYYTSSTIPTKNVTLKAQWSEVKKVARIDNNYYSTLQAAINDAISYEEVVLLVNTNENVTNNKNISINLDKHTLNGSLTNSENSQLLLTNGYVSCGTTCIYNNGKLTVGNQDIRQDDAVYITSGYASSTYASIGIQNSNGSKSIINNAVISTTTTNNTTGIRGGDIIFNNGSITVNNVGSIDKGYSSLGVNSSSIIFNNGSIDVNSNIGWNSTIGILAADVVINDGTINVAGNNRIAGIAGYDSSQNTVIINGGEISVDKISKYAFLTGIGESDITFIMNGGKIKSSFVGLSPSNNSSIFINGGTIQAEEGVLVSGSDTTFTMNDGTIYGTSKGLYVHNNHNTIMNGGSIYSDSDGIHAVNSSVVFNDGNIVGFVGIDASPAVITMNGGKITSESSGITAEEISSSITINNGTINSESNGIYISDGSSVTMNDGIIKVTDDYNACGIKGDNDTVITMNGGSIYTTSYQSNGIIDLLNSSIYFNDGIIYSKGYNTINSRGIDGSSITYPANKTLYQESDTNNGREIYYLVPVPLDGSVSITFDANDGTVSPNSLVKNVGDTFGTLPIPVKTDYDFIGWYTESSGGTKINTSDVINSNITLYAHWSLKPSYTITFNKNSTSATGLMANQTIIRDNVAPLKDNAFVNFGYIFVGWNTKANGKGTSYLDKADITLNKDIILYAQWLKTYTLTFNKNNVSATGDSYSLVLLSGFSTQIPDEAFTAYSLNDRYINSYNTLANGTGTSYSMSQNITITEDTTLYARWSYVTITSKIYWALQDNDNDGTNEKLVISNNEVNGNYLGSFSGNSMFTKYSDIPWVVGDYSTPDNLSYNVESVEVQGFVAPSYTAKWFYGVGYNASVFEAKLYNLNTSKVTNMNEMFSYSGYNATTWNIKGIDKFNTSNVRFMQLMFDSAGYNATDINLDLSKWNTSKVESMSNLFNNFGHDSSTFNINISNWTINFDSPNGFSCFFSGAGAKSNTFMVTLKNWKILQSIVLSNFFGSSGYTLNRDYAGQNATTFIVDFSDWDLSKAENIRTRDMFNWVGSKAKTFSANLSGWNTSNVTDMLGMLSYTATKATSWTFIIPPTNGAGINNTTSRFYGKDTFIIAPSGRQFTLATS